MILQYMHSHRIKFFYTSIFLLIPFAILGDLFLALSTNLEEALLANKVAYLGSIYLPLILMFEIFHMCQIKTSFFIQMLLFIASTCIYVLSCTTGYSEIYYTNPQFITYAGVSNYTTEYGPAHILWNIYLILYFVVGATVLIYTFITKKNISYSSLIAFIGIGAIGIGSFIFSRELGSDTLVMPAVYLFIEYIFLILIHRVGKYDIDATILDALEQQNTSAYISFTKDRRFVGANEIAMNHFSDLYRLRMDHILEPINFIGKTLNEIIDKFEESEQPSISSYFSVGEIHYKVILKTVAYGNRDYGYLFRIEDDTKMQRYVKFLDKYNNELSNSLQNKETHISAMQEKMIVGMANMVESRDSNTGGHIKRTSSVVHILVSKMKEDKSLKLTNDFYNAVIKAAPMHDLGKIAVDDMILRKPGKFTNEEFQIMKTHAEKGAAIVENLLKDIEEPSLVMIAKNVANYHHERYDGNGYPEHLSGDEIPLEARIMAIADVYDALVSERCYKEKMSMEDAYKLVLNGMGTQFDPKLKPYFVRSRAELEQYYSEVRSPIEP